jgi:MoxR-like ATPase
MARSVEVTLSYVPRTLWRETPDGRRERIGEEDLLGLGECLVVLGEPGMGKTRLLRRLADTAGIAACTARQLINRADRFTLLGSGRLIVIDALDEVAARQDVDWHGA